MLSLSRILDRLSPRPQADLRDLADFPEAASDAGRQIVTVLLEKRDVGQVEGLYQQSIEQWRTDWQCALAEVLSKLEPANNTRLILWLSACINDQRDEHAAALHGFIRKLDLTRAETPLWKDVSVHYALMQDDIGAAQGYIKELRRDDPAYQIVWPQIAVMRKLIAMGRPRDAVVIGGGLLADDTIAPNAVPILLDGLFQCDAYLPVSDYCMRALRDETPLGPGSVAVGAASMMASGRADLALMFLLDQRAGIEGSPHAWFILRECALKLDRYDELRPILESTIRAGDGDDAAFRTAMMLVDLNDLEGAEALLAGFADPTSEFALQLGVIIASQRPDMTGAFEAYGAFLDHPFPRTTVAQIYAGNLYGQAAEIEDLERAQRVMEAAQEAGAQGAEFTDLYIKTLISVGRVEEARQLREDAEGALRRDAGNRLAQYFLAESDQQDAARRASQKSVASARYRAVHNASPLPTPQTFSYDPARHDTLCFSCIFNGMEFLEWFLGYYRKLGVDHFILVDNGSTDGSAAYLSAQPDVSLFHATGSFKDAAHGVYWINDLMKTYAVGKWAFFVDMDEAFVFPLMDQGRRLSDLTSYFDAHGYGCAPSLMIDLFSSAGEGGSFADNCLFDASYLSFPVERAPYLATQGGFRRRMTGRNMLITKSPLVKVDETFSYLENNHFHTHLKPADVTTGLLHYKFVGAVSDRIEEAISRKEHFLGATFYKDLRRAITGGAGASDPFQPAAVTRRYDGAQDLVDAGVLTSTDAWRSFPYQGNDEPAQQTGS